MTELNVTVSATIKGSAEKVYAVLADYVNHHPHILPPACFTKLEVEEGGMGAGAMFRAGFKIPGQEQSMRMRVSEPVLGRVLIETDLDRGLVTKFIVYPLGDNQSEVTFDTTMKRSPSLQSWIERLIIPGYLQRVCRVELQQLDHLPAFCN